MNHVLADALQANMEWVGCPELTDDELAFAGSIRATLANQTNPMDNLVGKLRPEEAAWVREQSAEPVANFIVPRIYMESILAGSTDVGDVSWVCPTGQVITSAWPAGTPAHSWQAVSVGKSSAAHKSMLFAAKTIAGAAIDLIEDPEKLARAKAELATRLGHKPFVSPIPKDVKPAVIGKKA